MRAVTSAASAALLLCSSEAFTTPLRPQFSAATDRLANSRSPRLSALVSLDNLAPETAFTVVSDFAKTTVTSVRKERTGAGMPAAEDYDRTVTTALTRIEQDMEMLDEVVGAKAQLSGTEFLFLFGVSLAAGSSPLFCPEKVVEVLVPSAAAICAAVGISAEYVGKTAFANAKEITAVTVQAAAESEALLAGAERAKAIIPLCVGISTSASAFALLAPHLLETIAHHHGVIMFEAVYLTFPLISVLGAAVASLAFQDARAQSARAVGVGTRRFAKSNSIGRSWLSAMEQVEATAAANSRKLSAFAQAMVPAPLLGALCPGPLEFKAIVATAAGAAQAAYYLTTAEYEVARAVDAVALKARAAAVSETYATQGLRSAAILPFTSALGGLCAAASAAAVELLPFIHEKPLQALVAVFFPAAGAFFAAAASVSKSRCEVDAAAAKAASEAFAEAGLTAKDRSDKGALEPFRSVGLLMRLALLSTVNKVMDGAKVMGGAKKATVGRFATAS